MQSSFLFGKGLIDVTVPDRFQCREVREKCVLGSGTSASRRRVCAINAVMLEGERRMREALAETTLADVAAEVADKQPARLVGERMRWFERRTLERRSNTRRGRAGEDTEKSTKF